MFSKKKKLFYKYVGSKNAEKLFPEGGKIFFSDRTYLLMKGKKDTRSSQYEVVMKLSRKMTESGCSNEDVKNI